MFSVRWIFQVLLDALDKFWDRAEWCELFEQSSVALRCAIESRVLAMRVVKAAAGNLRRISCEVDWRW